MAEGRSDDMDLFAQPPMPKAGLEEEDEETAAAASAPAGGGVPEPTIPRQRRVDRAFVGIAQNSMKAAQRQLLAMEALKEYTSREIVARLLDKHDRVFFEVGPFASSPSSPANPPDLPQWALSAAILLLHMTRAEDLPAGGGGVPSDGRREMTMRQLQMSFRRLPTDIPWQDVWSTARSMVERSWAVGPRAALTGTLYVHDICLGRRMAYAGGGRGTTTTTTTPLVLEARGGRDDDGIVSLRLDDEQQPVELGLSLAQALENWNMEVVREFHRERSLENTVLTEHGAILEWPGTTMVLILSDEHRRAPGLTTVYACVPGSGMTRYRNFRSFLDLALPQIPPACGNPYCRGGPVPFLVWTFTRRRLLPSGFSDIFCSEL